MNVNPELQEMGDGISVDERMARLERLVSGLAGDIAKLARSLPSQGPAESAAREVSGRKDDCSTDLRGWGRNGGGGGGGGGVRGFLF